MITSRTTRLIFRTPCLVAVLLAVFYQLQQSPPLERNSSVAVSPALHSLLEFYGPRYDASRQLVREVYTGPGYHSALPVGSHIHPVRESLIYAVALLQRNRFGDSLRAQQIIKRVLTLQDRNPNSRTRGIWPWFLEERLTEMSAPDLNWADFCGSLLAQILVQHADEFPESLREEMKQSLRLAAMFIRKRNVGPGYTNIAILGGSVCVTAGELLNDDNLLEYGRNRLEKVVEHTITTGGFTEYNSPPYAKVVIGECERGLSMIQDEASRDSLEWLRRFTWTMIAESFHPPTQQWGGPHSRNSRSRLRISTVNFLSRRLGWEIVPHPSVDQNARPSRYAIVPAISCPEELQDSFRKKPISNLTLKRTFVDRGFPPMNLIGTTYFREEACLASIKRASFWTQRKPIIGYWKTEQDPAVMFRARFLHDGTDFASMAMGSDQYHNRVLAIFHALRGFGDWHRTLDRPADGKFTARDFRLRLELRGKGVSAEKLEDGRFSLRAGDYRIVVHTVPSAFADQSVTWELHREADAVFLDAVCYEGPPRTFDFGAGLPVRFGLALELLRRDEPHTDMPLEFTPLVHGSIKLAWQAEEDLRLHINTPARAEELETVGSPEKATGQEGTENRP